MVLSKYPFIHFYFKFRSARDNHPEMSIWNAAKAFNDQFKIKSWIVHHDVSKSPYAVVYSGFVFTLGKKF